MPLNLQKFNKKMKKFIIIVLIVVGFSSCSEYQKALKSEDVEVKFDEASKQYENGKYTKAIRLFEQIAPSYRGKPKAEKMFYMFSQSYYKTKQYYLSGYQFESFAAGYPKSDKIEEASYLGAKSYSTLSPVYSLDQTDTDKAFWHQCFDGDKVNNIEFDDVLKRLQNVDAFKQSTVIATQYAKKAQESLQSFNYPVSEMMHLLVESFFEK